MLSKKIDNKSYIDVS